MLLMQAAREEVIHRSKRHRDRCRLSVPVPPQAALSHAAGFHVPPQNGSVWGGEVCTAKWRRRWSTSTSSPSAVRWSSSVVRRRPAVTDARHRCCSSWLPDVRRIQFTYIFLRRQLLHCHITADVVVVICFFVIVHFPIKSVFLEQWRRQLWGTRARTSLDFQRFHF